MPLPESRRATILGHLASAGAAILAAILMTWPLARDAGDHILEAIYHWDAYTNAMIMGGRVDAALGRGPLSLYDNYFFAPLPNSIVYNENLFGLSLIFAPFYLIGKNPLLAYNLTLLLSTALSVYFTCLFVRRLTGSGLAGFIAGVAFAFSPYVMFELGRIQLVATQWIPACFLFLHRAIEDRRTRDTVGFWICYLLQIGTCLYYAMFLIPLLLLLGGALFLQNRPPRKVLFQFLAGGAAAGLIALCMVFPYFTARDTFSLERSLEFASGYDGQLDFFANVHETNRTLVGMHHPSRTRGAYEEIAFPGFTVLGLVVLALIVPLRRLVGLVGVSGLGGLTVRWMAIASMAMTSTLLSHTMLTGAAIVGIGIWHQFRNGEKLPFSGVRGLYLALLLLSIAMFLGLTPAEWAEKPVRGLYYYFHTYFPGFNGIRKVSRQAVMTTFVFCLLASFGSAWLFSKLKGPWRQAVAFGILLGSTIFELRTFPHPMRSEWAGENVPKAYAFLATLPKDDLITTAPQHDGARKFAGDAGMALHNYLSLYHKHRFVNGQSSWLPPVNDLTRRAMMRLPEESALRALQSVGARHLLLHAADLRHSRRDLPQLLDAQPEHYQHVFHEGADHVFTLAAPNDPTLELLQIPPLPPSARRLPLSELRPSPRLHKQARPELAIDGNLETSWIDSGVQRPGQFFELNLQSTQRIVAFEIENTQEVMEVPLSFELSVARHNDDWEIVAARPKLQFFHAQIYSPKTFVFRVVLAEPKEANRLRIRIVQPVPDFHFRIREAHVYVEP